MIETNELGGMGSRVPWWDHIDVRALRAIATVMQEGATKYAEGNWRRVKIREHMRHLLEHAANYLEAEQQYSEPEYAAALEELSHMATRGIMALAVHLQDEGAREAAPAGLAKPNGTAPYDVTFLQENDGRLLPR